MNSTSVKNYFIRQILSYGVLTEGSFELNSGVISPFYFEFEKFNDGKALNALGFTFLAAARELDLNYDVVYGTAYKGAILALAMSSYSRNLSYVVERKEAKERNNKGFLIGSSIENKDVLIVDDVATSLKSLRRSLEIVSKFNVNTISILVGVNRTGLEYPMVEDCPVNYIVDFTEVLTKFNPKMEEHSV